MSIEEVLVDTPTTRRLKEKPKRDYYFALQAEEVEALRQAGLPPASVLCFAAIRTAIRVTGDEWAVVPRRTFDLFDLPTDWWRLNVRRLEAAGFIECDRSPGKLRRYRLPKS